MFLWVLKYAMFGFERIERYSVPTNTYQLWESFGLARNAEGATRSESLRHQDRRLVVGSGEWSNKRPTEGVVF